MLASDTWTFHRREVLLQEQVLCLPAAAVDMSHSAAWLCVAVSSTCELHSTGKVLRSAPSATAAAAVAAEPEPDGATVQCLTIRDGVQAQENHRPSRTRVRG